MRRMQTLAVAAALLVTGTPAAAQSEKAGAAWFAMMYNPYGALPPVVTPTMAGGARGNGSAPGSFDFRYGRWSLPGENDSFNSFAIGGRAAGFGLVAGALTCDGCNTVVLLGGDYDMVLTTTPLGTGVSPALFSIGLRPGIGVGIPTGDTEGNTISGTIDVPISVSVPVATGAHFVPFLSPGFGMGRFSEGSGSETGTRAALAAGIAFVSAQGLGAHLGWRKIFIENGESTLGIGMSFQR